MKSILAALTAIVIALASPAAVAAQPIDIRIDDVRVHNPTVRIGQSYALKQGDTARAVVVIGGEAVIEGTVEEDVVVVLGKTRLSSTAVVHGAVIMVGGTITAADGARVDRELFVIGSFEGAPAFSPGGNQVVIGTAGLGAALSGLVPWLTGGLLLGRPIVPDVGWVWWFAGAFFLINLLLNVLFDAPVRAAAATLRGTPLTSFATGLLVMLLAGPVCFLLAVSLVGIAVIPFVLCAMVLAAVLGKIAFARWIGMSLVQQDEPDNRGQSLRSFVIGSAVMCIAYMVPILGLLTWAMAGVFGLGASTLAFHAAYRRENPKKPKPVKPTPVAAPVVNPPAVEPLMVSVTPGVQVGTGGPEGSNVPWDGGNLPAEGASYGHGGDLPPQGGTYLPRAAFIDRLAAFALDFILVVIVAQVLDLDRHVDAPLGRVGILLAIAYHVGFWAWKGTTVGGIICNLRVVRTDGSPLQFAEALVRGLTGIFSLAVAGLGFLWILKDPERQAWHDRVAGTYVVKVPRDWRI